MVVNVIKRHCFPIVFAEITICEIRVTTGPESAFEPSAHCVLLAGPLLINGVVRGIFAAVVNNPNVVYNCMEPSVVISRFINLAAKEINTLMAETLAEVLAKLG